MIVVALASILIGAGALAVYLSMGVLLLASEGPLDLMAAVVICCLPKRFTRALRKFNWIAFLGGAVLFMAGVGLLHHA